MPLAVYLADDGAIASPRVTGFENRHRNFGAGVTEPKADVVTVAFAGSGDAFGSGGRLQACIVVRAGQGAPMLLDCGATSLIALKRQGIDPNDVTAVLVSHLHVDHFGGLPHLILDGQFRRRIAPLIVAGPIGIAARLTDAMELMFPGSSAVQRRFAVEVVELPAGSPPVTVAESRVQAEGLAGQAVTVGV